MRIIAHLFVLTALIGLVACGGGSSDNDTPPPAAPDVVDDATEDDSSVDDASADDDTPQQDDDSAGEVTDDTAVEDTGPDTPEDDTTEADAADEDTAEGCTTDADCLPLDGDCCSTAGTCNADGTCSYGSLEGCCQAPADCDDGDDATIDVCAEACVENGCEYLEDSGCDAGDTKLDATFDDGSLGDASAFGADTVSIAASATRAVSPGYSAYFGVPDCETYYSGPLDANCAPADGFGNQSTAQNLTLVMPSVELDEDSAYHLAFWVDMAAEPAFDAGIPCDDATPCPGASSPPAASDPLQCIAGSCQGVTDFFAVYVDDGTDVTEIWKSTAALGVDNHTGGTWAHQAVDLSSYAGQTIVISMSFITDGGGDWNVDEDWYGVYVDNISIAPTCPEALCGGIDSTCPTDGDGCTSDACTPFAGGGGVCAYESASPGVACEACETAADCGDDACTIYTCEDGLCSAEADPSCCTVASSFPFPDAGQTTGSEGFEGVEFFTAWSVDDPYPNDDVSWNLSDARFATGSQSLYFGDLNSQTYEAEPENPAVATAWTPLFALEDSPASTSALSFWIYMSTEWDGVCGPSASDYDVLAVWIREGIDGTPQEVWNSADALCNSTDGRFVQVGIDLTAFADKNIMVGFNFDSGDSEGSGIANEFEGVYIDDVSVTSWCAADCLSGSDCGQSGACSSSWCNQGTCVADEAEANCCEQDSDCVGSGCTTGTCVDNVCAYNFVDDMNCCAAEWPSSTTATFESGDEGYTSVVNSGSAAWYRSDSAAFNGSYSMAFNDADTGVYGANASGELYSPVITVPPFDAGIPYVEFKLWMETEWDVNSINDFFPAFPIDELCVAFLSATEGASYSSCMYDGDTWHTTHLYNTTRGAWVTARVDMSEFRGEDVQVVFEFASEDFSNSFAGPKIDDVNFGSACGTVECIDSSECSSDDACYTASCSAAFSCDSEPSYADGCCYGGIDESLSEDFEGANVGWVNEPCTNSGGVAEDDNAIWQFATEGDTGGIPASDGSGMLYFGNGIDFGGLDKASCDAIASPEFALDPSINYTMEFSAYLDIEPHAACDGGLSSTFADNFVLSLHDKFSGQSEVLLVKEDLACSEFGTWTSHSVDLSAYAGSTVYLRASFDSVGADFNDGAGVAIDGLTFIESCD